MSIVSLEYLLFVAIIFAVYYIVPKKGSYQQIVLLIASYSFYLFAGITPLIFVLLTTGSVYFAALQMEKIRQNAENKRAAKGPMRKWLIGIMLFIFGILFVLKYYNFFADGVNGLFTTFKYDTKLPLVNMILPMGISFYMFQSIGYSIDVYRGKIEAEKSLFRFALFISFFPQAVQGPISRYDNLAPQLNAEHKFSYERFLYGLQLMIWGFFKKLVIADRLSIPVAAVFGSYTDYDGLQIFIAIICYALQIYADFSGGIDIIRGVAQCLDIELIENFKRPYFATSVPDYWRRWHISLTEWMRDYVFYSMTMSKAMGNVRKWSKKHLKGRAAKQLSSYVVTFTVFFLIGVWHGSGWGNIMFGLYNATVIVLGLIFKEELDALTVKLKVNTECLSWRIWQILRTFTIMVVGKTFARATSIGAGFNMLKACGGMFDLHDLIHRVTAMGLDLDNWFVLALAVMVFFAVSVMQECGINVRERLGKQILPVRWAIYILGIMSIVIFGIYGPGYDASSFIYRGF